MTNRVIPSGFIRSVLQNGAGRYVCQLQRLTFKFCKTSNGSQGLRKYIEEDMLDFARHNSGVAVYLLPRNMRVARVVAEYLNGGREEFYCNNFEKDEIIQWIELLRTQSGIPTMRYRKYMHTDTPSVQGVWTPFTRKPTEFNVRAPPYQEKTACEAKQLSATEQLLEIAKSEKK